MNHQELDYDWLLEEVRKKIKEPDFSHNIFVTIKEILKSRKIELEAGGLNEAITILSAFDEEIRKLAESKGFIFAPYIPLFTSDTIGPVPVPATAGIMSRYAKNLGNVKQLYSKIKIK